MYKITWDNETGGILLNLKVVENTLSVAPRPVFWEELDLLGLSGGGCGAIRILTCPDLGLQVEPRQCKHY